uniref:Protein kinase domain-containing protein n=1 Tax=Rhabditophanes sp. KR3021 TaxID=114890 RepID=A0AC35U6A7_9BILA
MALEAEGPVIDEADELANTITLYEILEKLMKTIALENQTVEEFVDDLEFVDVSECAWDQFFVNEKLSLFTIHENDKIEIDVLLPNGFLLSLKRFSVRSTLEALKIEVFYHAKRYGFLGNLTQMSDYIFYMLSPFGIPENIYDETKPIYVYDLSSPLLGLHEPPENLMEKRLESEIGSAIGFQITDLHKNLNPEANCFRTSIFEFCNSTLLKRDYSGSNHYFFFGDNVVKLDVAPNFEAEKRTLSDSTTTEIWYRSAEDEEQNNDENCIRIQIPTIINTRFDIVSDFNYTVGQIIDLALESLKSLGLRIDEKSEEFLLQVAGKKTYISKHNIPIMSFEYVRSSFQKYKSPILLLRRKKIVYRELGRYKPIHIPYYVRAVRKNSLIIHPKESEEKPTIKYLWEIEEDFTLKLDTASNVTIFNENQKIFVRVALTVGRHVLKQIDSPHLSPNDPRWRECQMNLGYYVKDIPSGAQLSFALVSIVPRKYGMQTVTKALGWCNIRLFDYQNNLVQGRKTLYLYKSDGNLTNYINPSGSEGINVKVGNHPRIVVYFKDYSKREKTFHIKYPPIETVYEYVEILKQRPDINNEVPVALNPSLVKIEDMKRLKGFIKELDGTKLSEEEQEYIWLMREYICVAQPNLLVVMADSKIVWKSRDYTTQFYELLSRWGPITVESAIELLDNRHRDCLVRKFAVETLDQWLDDDRFKLFMIHLIQGIKYEPYYDNPLVTMLMRRSLMNYQLSHQLFWLLRSELEQEIGEHDASNGKPARLNEDTIMDGRYTLSILRCTLMLEVLLRSNYCHMDSIIRQVRMVKILFELSQQIKQISGKEACTKFLQKELEGKFTQLQLIESPLNPSVTLGELCIEECKVLSSAKQPLRLVWKNLEPLAKLANQKHQIIFKNGDDLRQDMLTLQVMKIMDAFWKSMQYNFCMSIYQVLPMGYNIGMIHVVQNCATLYEIQIDRTHSLSLNMGTTVLEKWLKIHNPETKDYLECVDRFTKSAAGYCVATYILGVKDRHQDNIMLRKDGRMFHIDFGHFLGHKKKKLGITRDREPFILTEHFIYVVSKGRRAKERRDHAQDVLRKRCREAFLILLDHSRLFISLFRMMLSMGLPELASINDLNYLQKALMTDLPKDEAGLAFNQLFATVTRSDISTRTNWIFHSIKHF